MRVTREAEREANTGRNLSILAKDGYRLGATLFEPRSAAHATLVVHGATAVPARYYARFGEHMASSGVRVLSYDFRGVGASRPLNLRGFEASMSDWAELDARGVMAYAKQAFGRRPIVHLGHSFGGQLLGLVDDAREADAAVLVGSQLGYYAHWPFVERLRLALLWNGVVPLVTRSFGYLPGQFGLGEDLPSGVAREWARWCSHPDYLMGAHPSARARFARFDRPTLLFSMTDDAYAPEAAVEHLMRVLDHAPLEHRRVSPAELGVEAIGHFGFFRPRFADTLWREVRWFVEDVATGRVGLRPSGRAPFQISELDIAEDLAYGRA